ncbi:hypothetical protein HNQ07_003575 [Deinococcus metalli]|uniref:Uncharacterized protein n=2 Tax=Deinococcus metalli TaxID=1141878 RepID=A0A7W8KK88_9DEIO|nr:hypothetical protein [Deinococcus metalli]MBB5378074.1 hypothetical protein [Deinococcus metalli]
MPTSVPPPAGPPMAQFTVTVYATHVDVTDHADHSRHTFATLLGAVSYLEMTSLSREQVAQHGGLH